MPNLTDADLRDPMPPIPGSKERAAVAARAHQLGRRRRMMQGAGALGMVAAVAVGVAALTAGGSSPGNGGQRIEAAAVATTDAPVTTDAPAATTTVPAPAPTVPAPAPDTAGATDTPNGASEPPAPQQETAPPAPAAPTTFTVSGTVSNIPEGATLTLTLTGPGGTFTAIAGPGGAYSMSGVPAGSYEGQYYWDAGGAAQVAKLGGISISGDTNISFALQ